MARSKTPPGNTLDGEQRRRLVIVELQDEEHAVVGAEHDEAERIG